MTDPRLETARALLMQGELGQACALYRQCCADAPQDAAVHNLYGLALFQRGSLVEAEPVLAHAFALAPDDDGIRYNLGTVRLELGEVDAARDCLAGIAEDSKYFVPSARRLADGLINARRFDAADAVLERLLHVAPGDAAALLAQARVLERRGAFAPAARALGALVDRHPLLVPAWFALGRCAFALGDLGAARAHLAQSARLARQRFAQHMADDAPMALRLSKLEHDLAQLDHLRSIGLGGEPLAAHRAALASVLEALRGTTTQATGMVELSAEHKQRLRATLNQPLYREEVPLPAGSTVNPALDIGALTASWRAQTHPSLEVDDLLTEEALQGLERFLVRSTIFHDCRFDGGYVGANLEDGLACPLVLKIAADLRQAFQAIIGDSGIGTVWAFKYDPRLAGTPPHAEFSRVTINLWVTADEANLVPGGSGLLVHRARVPDGWGFARYNVDDAAIKSLLRDAGPPHAIPYRRNRAQIFDSSLLHETGEVRFRDDYASRRTNISFLYGFR